MGDTGLASGNSDWVRFAVFFGKKTKRIKKQMGKKLKFPLLATLKTLFRILLILDNMEYNIKPSEVLSPSSVI